MSIKKTLDQISKKQILLLSIFVVLTALTIDYFGTYQVCNQSQNCASLLHALLLFSLPFFPILVLSLITYQLRTEVFKPWRNFSILSLILIYSLIFFAPETPSDWMVPYDKGRASFLFSTFYFLLALVLVVWQSWKLRKK